MPATEHDAARLEAWAALLFGIVLPMLALLRHSLPHCSAAALCLAMACSGEEKSAAHHTGKDSADTQPPVAGDAEDCAAWLSDAPFAGTASLCEHDSRMALEQLAADRPSRISLTSGRAALVWLPEDWAGRTHQSILILLHGSTGCQEGTFADARWAFGDTHALLSLSHKTGPESFVEAADLQLDLDEALDTLSAACPTEEATHLMYGVSRGGVRTIQLAGLDRAGPRRLAGVVPDSGSGTERSVSGLSFEGTRFMLWCGEYDPDPVQESRTTCDVMVSDLAPALERGGALVDEVALGEQACHGMFSWDCTPDCLSCEGRTGPGGAGPHATRVAAWLEQAAR